LLFCFTFGIYFFFLLLPTLLCSRRLARVQARTGLVFKFEFCFLARFFIYFDFATFEAFRPASKLRGVGHPSNQKPLLSSLKIDRCSTPINTPQHKMRKGTSNSALFFLMSNLLRYNLRCEPRGALNASKKPLVVHFYYLILETFRSSPDIHSELISRL